MAWPWHKTICLLGALLVCSGGSALLLLSRVQCQREDPIPDRTRALVNEVRNNRAYTPAEKGRRLIHVVKRGMRVERVVELLGEPEVTNWMNVGVWEYMYLRYSLTVTIDAKGRAVGAYLIEVKETWSGQK